MRKSSQDELQKLANENKRLKKSIEDLWTINQLARIISSTIPVNRILEKVVDVSVKAIKAEQGTISLLDPEENHDTFKTLIRKVDRSQPIGKYRLDNDLTGWMIKNRKPLLINDISRDETFKLQRELFKEIHSILSVPLLCKGRLIGVLNVFNKKGGLDFSSEDQRLLSIISSQSAQVIENARLYEEEKQLREFEKELETARSMQMRLLPKESPHIPCFEVAGVSHPAREVGGDYYDFIDLGDKSWGIALGDVVGKGVPAALLMSNLQATLRSQAWTNTSIVECISKTNNILYLNTESNKFATLFYGTLSPETSVFRYVNAGHNFPFHFDQKGNVSSLEKGGIVLGLIPDCPFEEDEIELKPGELVVIYSDGVTEAENTKEELFDEQRLQEVVNQSKHLNAQQLVDLLVERVKSFTGAKAQDDDITLIVLKAL
ncbi:SpoIIE family protein phosphatase [bacterium]|nr:SpoIIE family protein phosphatase [bacterium]